MMKMDKTTVKWWEILDCKVQVFSFWVNVLWYQQAFER